MVVGNHSQPEHIAVGGIITVFLRNTVIGGNGQDRTGIGVLGDIVRNISVGLAEPCHLVDIVHAAVDIIGKQLQACFSGLNQAVLQVVLKYVVADAADNHAHPQNTGKGDGDDSLLDAAGMGFHGVPRLDVWDWRISQSVQNADAFFTVGLSPCRMGNSQIRADALFTLLSQGICSLIAQEKQISPSALLVFLLRLLHYTMFWGRRERHGGKNEKKCMKV